MAPHRAPKPYTTRAPLSPPPQPLSATRKKSKTLATMNTAASTTARTREKPLTLILRAAGTPDKFAGKLARLASVAAIALGPRELDRRLNLLKARNVIDDIPTRIQLFVGGSDMLRFWIVPASKDYYAQQGIDFSLHQLLRFLDEPASVADPIGVMSDRDGIIGHLMQVVHANPMYDYELLQMFDDGLDQLDQQLEQMINGTHPRHAAISAIVEEPTYHAELLANLRSWRHDPTTPPLRRSNVMANPKFTALDRTFGSMRTSFRYFMQMPTTISGARRHLREVQSFPWHLGTPE